MWFQGQLLWFLVAFHDFCCLVRNLLTFQSDFWVTPDPASRQVGGKCFVPGNNNSRIPETDILEILRPRLGILRLRREYRMHDTLDTGLQTMPRSLVAPTRRAGGWQEALFSDGRCSGACFHWKGRRSGGGFSFLPSCNRDQPRHLVNAWEAARL